MLHRLPLLQLQQLLPPLPRLQPIRLLLSQPHLNQLQVPHPFSPSHQLQVVVPNPFNQPPRHMRIVDRARIVFGKATIVEEREGAEVMGEVEVEAGDLRTRGSADKANRGTHRLGLKTFSSLV